MTPSRRLVLALIALLAVAPPLLGADPKSRRKFNACEDYVQSKDWPQVAALAQQLLDLDDTHTIDATTPAHAAAERLLRGLPEAGRDAYERAQGPAAREALAGADKDEKRLADLARRYLYT